MNEIASVRIPKDIDTGFEFLQKKQTSLSGSTSKKH